MRPVTPRSPFCSHRRGHAQWPERVASQAMHRPGPTAELVGSQLLRARTCRLFARAHLRLGGGGVRQRGRVRQRVRALLQSLKTRPVEHPRLAHLAWNLVSFLRSTRLGRTVVRSKLQSPSSHNELLLPTEAGGARVRAGSDASPSRHAPW